MRLVIPFVRSKLRPEVQAFGESLGAEFADLIGDTTAYFSLMARLWRQQKHFTIIEEDVLPTVALLDAMENCNRVWCAGFYEQNGQPVPWTLGCVRFSGTLLNRYPDAMTHAISRCPMQHFNQLDLALFGTLRAVGYTEHLHQPPVTHLHSSPWPS